MATLIILLENGNKYSRSKKLRSMTSVLKNFSKTSLLLIICRKFEKKSIWWILNYRPIQGNFKNLLRERKSDFSRQYVKTCCCQWGDFLHITRKNWMLGIKFSLSFPINPKKPGIFEICQTRGWRNPPTHIFFKPRQLFIIYYSQNQKIKKFHR